MVVSAIYRPMIDDVLNRAVHLVVVEARYHSVSVERHPTGHRAELVESELVGLGRVAPEKLSVTAALAFVGDAAREVGRYAGPVPSTSSASASPQLFRLWRSAASWRSTLHAAQRLDPVPSG